MEDNKIIFLTHPYYAVNNPDNDFRIYHKAKRASKWTYIKCKNKKDYRSKIKEYILGFFEYSRDEEKAYTSIPNYVNEDSSLFDYFMGSKKSEEVMERNQMKREQMAMLKDGSFLKDSEVEDMKIRWGDYIENSNVQLAVLSFNQKYIDDNIPIEELHKKITVNLMPKFLNYCGYENPTENLEWVVALHNDRDGNYHFHISWIEKEKSYRYGNDKVGYKQRLKLTDNEINFMKRQAALTIERKRLYTPALTELNKDLDDLKSYFNPKDHNYTLKNIKDLELEEKIIKLGFLLNEIRNTDKKYIKYNSLPKRGIGREIRTLTKEIKAELFKSEEIILAKDNINKSIKKINDILIDIDKRNNISNVGYESAEDNKMIRGKLDKYDNYIYNAIVNHALYNYDKNKKLLNKDDFTLEDVINQVAYEEYKTNFKKVKTTRQFKTHILKNYFLGVRYKSKAMNALDRLSYRSDKSAEDFYKMFEEEQKNENEI